MTGTLEYLSPEAWRHARDEDERYRPTAKDEQWALGVTFYWLLTDRLPFGLREDPLMTRRVLRENSQGAPRHQPARAARAGGHLPADAARRTRRTGMRTCREMCGELRRVLEASAGG